jgi:hypothetical protein
LPLGRDDADEPSSLSNEAEVASRAQRVIDRANADERLVREFADRERATPAIPTLFGYDPQDLRLLVIEELAKWATKPCRRSYRSNCSLSSASQH